MATVLVIEDHDGLREYVAEVLRMKNFRVTAVSDGVEGLRAAFETPPDVILCDIMMEPINGLDVLREIRGNPVTAPIPFIIISARSDRATMRYAMSLGADDYLTKPFTRGDLIEAIQMRTTRHAQIYRAAEKQIESAKQQLMRMLTHELRTPLVSINMVVDIISRQRSYIEPQELQELLDSLISGSKRLSRMVEQIVFMTQLHAGAIAPDLIRKNGIPMPLWETLVAAIGLARKYAYRSANVNIDLIERDTDAMVLSNTSALKHALAELIINGINFSPEDGHLTITQWLAEDRVWISITDQGPGIEPDQLQRALESFQQIDRETREQQGIGLGLGLAHHLIEAHGGMLDLKSVKGKGTQAIVSLPVFEQTELPPVTNRLDAPAD